MWRALLLILLPFPSQLWRQATATRASSIYMMRNIVPPSHIDIQYVFILTGFWNVYVAHCGNVNASAPIHRMEVWSSSLYIMRNECSAEHTVAVSTGVLESADHRIWCTSSFLPCPRTFPEGNKIHRTSTYLVWSWHLIKAPWEAHQETRRNTGALKCVCCYVQ